MCFRAQISLYGTGNTSGLCETVSLADGFFGNLIWSSLFQFDSQSTEQRVEFLEGHYIVHTFIALCFLAFGNTRADENDLCIGIFLLGDAGCIVHGRSGRRNILFHVRNMFVYQFDVRRTAGSGHEFLAFFQLFEQLMCFVAGCFHCAFCHFDDIGKSDFFQGTIYLVDGSLELSQNRRSRNGNQFFTGTDRFQNIKYL